MGREGGLPRMLQTTDFFRIVPTSLGARNSFFYNICPFILAQTDFGDPQRSREYCFYPDDLCYSVISRKFLYSRNFETITPERQLEVKESLCNLYTYPTWILVCTVFLRKLLSQKVCPISNKVNISRANTVRVLFPCGRKYSATSM